MIRRSGLLASATIVAAFALSACQPVESGDQVATVNGTKISEQELSDFIKVVASATTSTTSPTGETAPAGPTVAETQERLTDLIRARILGADTSVADTKQALAAAVAALPPASAEDAKMLYERGPVVSQFVCLGILDAADKATSQEAATAINNGMSLAEAVAKYSSNQDVQDAGGIVRDSNGIECVLTSTIGSSDLAAGVQALEAVPVGQAISMDIQGTPVVFLLRPFDELEPTMQATIAKSAATEQAFESAKVDVASAYGRWDAATASVVPLT